MKLIEDLKENKINLFLILLPVLICIIIYLTPGSFQEIFVLYLDNLNYWSWFTNIFIHQNFSHLFMNMLIYVLAILSAFKLTPKEDKKTFVWSLYSMIILIPLITLLLIIYFRNIGWFPANLIVNKGFSGMSAGALGILGFAISKYHYLLLKGKRSKMRLLNNVFYILLPSLAIMIFNLNYILAIVIIIYWIVMILLWTKPYFDHPKMKKIKSRAKLSDVIYFMIPFIILFFGVMLLIPKIPISNGSIINTPAHLFGFLIGYGFSFIINIIFSKRLR